MTVGLQPSYWQQIAAGVAVIIPTLIVGALLVVWLSRSVLEPRAAGRRWPEGARGVRPVVELIVDLQRRSANPAADLRARLQAVRFGLVVGACTVIGVSTGLVLTQPGLGLYVIAVLLAIDALVDGYGAHRADPEQLDPVRSGSGRAMPVDVLVRVGMAVVIALSAGVVHAQWGTASVPGVVAAQATGSIGGLDVLGLPTLLVHPATAVLAVLACHLSAVTMARSPAVTDGGPTGLFAQVVAQAWLIALSAWLVVAFLGGGAVPWSIDNPGTGQVVSVAVFATKVSAVTVALAWARATWPILRLGTVRPVVALAGVITSLSIAATSAIRHLT